MDKASSKILWVENAKGYLYFKVTKRRHIILPKRHIPAVGQAFLTMILQIDHLLDDPREVLIFQQMHLFCKGIRGVLFLYDHLRLEDRLTMIILLIYIMNGDAGFGFRGGDHGLVHKTAIHPLPPKFW